MWLVDLQKSFLFSHYMYFFHLNYMYVLIPERWYVPLYICHSISHGGHYLGKWYCLLCLLKFLFMSISFSITSEDCAFTRSLEISLTIACVEGATQLNFWLAFKECTRGTLCVRMCPQNFALSANKTAPATQANLLLLIPGYDNHMSVQSESI